MYVRLADDRAQRRTMMTLLTDQETALDVVCESSDPRGLLAQTQTVHPKLVALDWAMPGLRGAGLPLALYYLDYP